MLLRDDAVRIQRGCPSAAFRGAGAAGRQGQCTGGSGRLVAQRPDAVPCARSRTRRTGVGQVRGERAARSPRRSSRRIGGRHVRRRPARTGGSSARPGGPGLRETASVPCDARHPTTRPIGRSSGRSSGRDSWESDGQALILPPDRGTAAGLRARQHVRVRSDLPANLARQPPAQGRLVGMMPRVECPSCNRLIAAAPVSGRPGMGRIFRHDEPGCAGSAPVRWSPVPDRWTSSRCPIRACSSICSARQRSSRSTMIRSCSRPAARGVWPVSSSACGARPIDRGSRGTTPAVDWCLPVRRALRGRVPPAAGRELRRAALPETTRRTTVRRPKPRTVAPR